MRETRFRRGDKVRFRMAGRSVNGHVKEDRGPIGMNGRRLYLVEFRADVPAPSQIELPAEQLELQAAADR
jgi:hypothetical protein